MKTKIIIAILVAIVIIGVLVFALRGNFASNPAGQNWKTGAGTSRQPPSGLSKNESLFNQYFSNMGLVTDGWTGFEDTTNSFSSSDNVIVLANATSSVTILVYVDDSGNRGLFTGIEKEQNAAVGLTAINLGKFQPSSYIARILVNDVLTENLTFNVT